MKFSKNQILVIYLFITLTSIMVFAVEPDEPILEKTRIFYRDINPQRVDFRFNYRIPSLIATNEGTILAFTDKRKAPKDYPRINIRDWGHETDVSVLRSTDNGKTWSEEKIIASKKTIDIHGGPALLDSQTGRIFKFMRFHPAWDYKTSKEYASVTRPAFCQTDSSSKMDGQTATTRESPVIRWTADKNEMNFSYDFIQNTETITLYIAKPETGAFSHHSYIIYFKGVFFAIWSNHLRDEDASGQRVLLRHSEDQGKTWTPFVELFPPLDRNIPASEAFIKTRSQVPNGFAVVDGVLYAISDVWDWQGPNIRHKRRDGQGRLVRSVNTDGTMGEIFWLRKDPPHPIEGFPVYPAGDPILVEKINNYLRLPGNEIQMDFTYLTAPRPMADDNHQLEEPTPAWKLSDGTWAKLYRDSGIQDRPNISREEIEESKSRRNYASFSFDDGKTWTTPIRTNFPDACARSTAGVLPDGQIYVINNVLPISPKKGGRVLLAISLSKDGLTFDRVAVIRFISPPKRYKGRAKAIGFQYPHSVIVGDYLWVMYSVNKEDIQLTRIPLSELAKF